MLRCLLLRKPLCAYMHVGICVCEWGAILEYWAKSTDLIPTFTILIFGTLSG